MLNSDRHMDRKQLRQWIIWAILAVLSFGVSLYTLVKSSKSFTGKNSFQVAP